MEFAYTMEGFWIQYSDATVLNQNANPLHK